jgi:hypothetical protein
LSPRCADRDEVDIAPRKSPVICLVLALLEGADSRKASGATSDFRRHKVLFRFWLITSLIVAFVTYCGAFGIQLTPAADVQSAFAQRDPGPAVFDDDGR